MAKKTICIRVTQRLGVFFKTGTSRWRAAAAAAAAASSISSSVPGSECFHLYVGGRTLVVAPRIESSSRLAAPGLAVAWSPCPPSPDMWGKLNPCIPFNSKTTMVIAPRRAPRRSSITRSKSNVSGGSVLARTKPLSTIKYPTAGFRLLLLKGWPVFIPHKHPYGLNRGL